MLAFSIDRQNKKKWHPPSMAYGVDKHKNLIPTGRFLGSYSVYDGGTVDIDLSEVNDGDSFLVSMNSNFSEDDIINIIKVSNPPSENRYVVVFKLSGNSISRVQRPSAFSDQNSLMSVYIAYFRPSGGSMQLNTLVYRDEDNELLYVSGGMRYFCIFVSV